MLKSSRDVCTKIGARPMKTHKGLGKNKHGHKVNERPLFRGARERGENKVGSTPKQSPEQLLETRVPAVGESTETRRLR